ncbi:MAG: hypothetical protein ABGX25_01815 [Nautiliaceae bacterium]
MERRYDDGFVFERVKKIEAVKYKEGGTKEKVALYYKDIDGKIKPADNGILTEEFITAFQNKLREKYGNVADRQNTTQIYISKNDLNDKREVFHFLIDTENEKVYFEAVLKKVKDMDKYIEGDYIRVLTMPLGAGAEMAYEVESLCGDSLIS